MNKKKKPAAKDVIAYVLYKAQKNEEVKKNDLIYPRTFLHMYDLCPILDNT
jgi:hypothetical protein